MGMMRATKQVIFTVTSRCLDPDGAVPMLRVKIGGSAAGHVSGDSKMASRENWTKRPEFEVFTLENILVLIWKAPPIYDGVKACARATEILRLNHPSKKIGFLTYVEPRAQSGSPSEPVRNGLSSFLRANQQHIVASVVIYEGTGFRATIVRSVVTAIQVASALDFPAQVSASRGAGAKWLLDKMRGQTQVGVSELVALLIEDERPSPELGR